MQPYIFIYHSKDSFWLEQQINLQIKNAMQNTSTEIVRLRVNKNNPINVLEALQSPSFFSTNLAVVVYNYDSGNNKLILMEWVANARKDCLLFLVKNEVKFASKAFEEEVRKLHSVSVNIEFFIKEERLRKRLVTFAKNRGLVLSKTAEEKLTAFFVENPSLWESEMEKISTYFLNFNKTIAEENLEDIVCWESEIGDFSLIDKFLDFPPKRSIPHFENFILMQGNFHRLLILLQNETEKILRFKEMKQATFSDQAAYIKLKIFFEKAKKKLLRRSKQFSFPKLYCFLNGLYETERLLKTASFTHAAIGKPSVNLRSKFFFYKTLALPHL